MIKRRAAVAASPIRPAATHFARSVSRPTCKTAARLSTHSKSRRMSRRVPRNYMIARGMRFCSMRSSESESKDLLRFWVRTVLAIGDTLLHPSSSGTNEMGILDRWSEPQCDGRLFKAWHIWWIKTGPGNISGCFKVLIITAVREISNDTAVDSKTFSLWLRRRVPALTGSTIVRTSKITRLGWVNQNWGLI